MNEMISVVVPAYNVQDQVGKCLDTILGQTYKALEVIVVNDGSTDGTEGVIRPYLADSRVKYVTQENTGVAAARNAGIRQATGKYLALVDSDDYLEPETYEKLHAALTETGADMAVCDYNLVFDDRVMPCYSGMKDEIVDVAADPLTYFYRYCACPRPNNYIWTRLYHTQMIRDAKAAFQSFKIGDDTVFNFTLIPRLGRVVHLPDALYNYYQRPTSITNVRATQYNLAACYVQSFQYMMDYLEQNGYQSFLAVAPIYAYTRVRSIFFYSRAAGLGDADIAENIAVSFQRQPIARYLEDTSQVAAYAAANGFSEEEAEKIRHIMRCAAQDPHALEGMEIR